MIRGLDGLRAVAITLVILFHCSVIGFGWIGVPIFFVLSGYLITRILLEDSSAPFGSYLWTFYGRRFLRIFPLYFVYLGIVLVAGRAFESVDHGLARAQMPYAATYTYNFFYATLAPRSPFLTHLWSLSVEEQFYLLWPLFVFSCPRNILPRVVLGLFVAGPILRMAGYVLWQATGLGGGDIAETIYVLPTSHVDAFATGALLCFYQPKVPAKSFWVATAAILGLLVVMRARGESHILALGLPAGRGYIWGYSVLNVFSVCLIPMVREAGAFQRLMSSRPLVHIGRISYGMYVIHYPLAFFLGAWLKPHLGDSRVGSLVIFGLVFAATTALASLSFYWFEKPLLQLKDRLFPRFASTAPGNVTFEGQSSQTQVS